MDINLDKTYRAAKIISVVVGLLIIFVGLIVAERLAPLTSSLNTLESDLDSLEKRVEYVEAEVGDCQSEFVDKEYLEARIETLKQMIGQNRLLLEQQDKNIRDLITLLQRGR